MLTHWHPDHSGGVEPLARRFNVPVRAFPLTFERIGLPTSVDVIGLRDGDVIDLEGMSLKTHFTPGHAPDHLAFEIEGGEALISGDLHSSLATMVIIPPEGHMTTFLETLLRMDALRFRKLLPAHGMPLPGKSLRKLHAHRLQRDEQIEAILTDGWLPHAEVAKITYAEVPDVPAFLTEGRAHAHLERLESLGRAEGRWHEEKGWSWRRSQVERREP
jgi:glyoxylase-like metal-dependent hydrolase (beta-lactamase superfamily II)